MIGSSVYHMLAYDGKVLGVSGIVHSSVTYLAKGASVTKPDLERTRWKLAFVAGSVVAGSLLSLAQGLIEERLGVVLFDAASKDVSWGTSALVGFLVGLGTKVSKGGQRCGVCHLKHPASSLGQAARRAICSVVSPACPLDPSWQHQSSLPLL